MCGGRRRFWPAFSLVVGYFSQYHNLKKMKNILFCIKGLKIPLTLLYFINFNSVYMITFELLSGQLSVCRWLQEARLGAQGVS